MPSKKLRKENYMGAKLIKQCSSNGENCLFYRDAFSTKIKIIFYTLLILCNTCSGDCFLNLLPARRTTFLTTYISE